MPPMVKRIGPAIGGIAKVRCQSPQSCHYLGLLILSFSVFNCAQCSRKMRKVCMVRQELADFTVRVLPCLCFAVKSKNKVLAKRYLYFVCVQSLWLGFQIGAEAA